jgi:hypothetical protein
MNVIEKDYDRITGVQCENANEGRILCVTMRLIWLTGLFLSSVQ